MFDAGLTVESLRDCLAGLPPVELEGMALLKERRPHGQFFPQLEGGQMGIPREVIAEAVTESVGYTERCRPAAQQLMKLTPIPLTVFSILEYGLQTGLVRGFLFRLIGDPADIGSEPDGPSDSDYPLSLVELTAYPQRSALEPLLTVD